MADKIPKKLNIETGCFFEPFIDPTLLELTEAEIIYRRKFPSEFVMRIGSRFFFQFRHRKIRDDFLKVIEATERTNGNLTERIIIPTGQ